MGTMQSKYQGRYKHLKNKKDANQHYEPARTNGEKTATEVIRPCFAPLASMEDTDDIPMSPSPSLFSMPPFDDVIRRMTSVNQNADSTDPNDYDDESIIVSEFDEDSISVSWAVSFHSSMEIDDRINQDSTDIVSDIITDIVSDIASDCRHDGHVVESRALKKKAKKPRSIVKSIRKCLRRYREKRERKRPKGWVWWTPEGTLCVVDENGEFYHEHHVVDKMRFRRHGTDTLRYWVSQECSCSD